MSFNITGFDPDVFAAFNTAIYVILFSIFTLPNFLLNILCVVALILAKTINWQIKTTLINIFTAELVISIGVSFVYLGYPLRVYESLGDEAANSCAIGLGIQVIGSTSNATATAIYAITVYTFLKYGPKKIKWYVMAVSIALPWVLNTTIGLFAATEGFSDYVSNNGFCVRDSENESILFDLVAAIGGLVLFVNVCLIVVFGILTYCVRANVLDESVEIKKAITKILLYHSIKISIVLFQYLVTGGVSLLRPPITSHADVIGFLVMEFTLNTLILDISGLLTPIISLIFLRPLREALRVSCPCCKWKKSSKL